MITAPIMRIIWKGDEVLKFHSQSEYFDLKTKLPTRLSMLMALSLAGASELVEHWQISRLAG